MILGERRQHHGGNPIRRIVGVKGSPRVGGANQPIVLVGRQQHEFALAPLRDFDRSSEGSLNDLTGSVAQVGEGKMCQGLSP